MKCVVAASARNRVHDVLADNSSAFAGQHVAVTQNVIIGAIRHQTAGGTDEAAGRSGGELVANLCAEEGQRRLAGLLGGLPEECARHTGKEESCEE